MAHQAAVILGDTHTVSDVIATALSGHGIAAPEVTDAWIAQRRDHHRRGVGDPVDLATHPRFRRSPACRARRGTGLDHAIAARLTEAALCEPFSVDLGLDATADQGEPGVLRRRDDSSVYRVHNA